MDVQSGDTNDQTGIANFMNNYADDYIPEINRASLISLGARNIDGSVMEVR